MESFGIGVGTYGDWLESPERAALPDIAYEMLLNEKQVIVGQRLPPAPGSDPNKIKYKMIVVTGPKPFTLQTAMEEIPQEDFMCHLYGILRRVANLPPTRAVQVYTMTWDDLTNRVPNK